MPISTVKPRSLLPLPHSFRRELNRVDNVRVAGTPAKIPFQPVRDFLPSRLGVALKQLHAGHDHAGRAIAALQAVTFPEPLLHGMQLTVARESLNGGHFTAIGLDRKQRARLHSLAVEQHRAGAAQRGLAADVRASEFAVFTEEMGEQQAGFDVMLVLNSVDFYLYEAFHGTDSVHSFRCRNGASVCVNRTITQREKSKTFGKTPHSSIMRHRENRSGLHVTEKVGEHQSLRSVNQTKP